MTGFLGAIVAPYPRPQSYWLALWHVLPETKGTGLGGRLLAQMQEIAEDCGGWIGTFGAGPEALPVYLKRGYAVRAGRRWIYDGDDHDGRYFTGTMHSDELLPPREWIDYRYHQHPTFEYDTRGECVFRTERNEWGVVTHAVRLGRDCNQHVPALYKAHAAEPADCGTSYLMDAWSFDCPGPGWSLAPEDLPSVFHPPAARGNITYAVGRPFLPGSIHKGDCDQDRPNIPTDAALTA